MAEQKKEEIKTLSIYEKLRKVQTGLKAPKGQYNSFGKYAYRSCEDILEALKPLLDTNRLVLTLNDDIILVGDRIYVKAEATLVNIDNPSEVIKSQAYAREEESKKGMDGSQVTGASSSYARKYCLNGMFNIDDNKDSDTTNTGSSESTGKSEEALATEEQVEKMKELKLEAWVEKKFNKKLNELTYNYAKTLIASVEARKKAQAEAKQQGAE